MKLLFILALALIFTGCQKYVHIESNTSWSGAINDASVDGSGNRDIDINNSSCAVFQKETKEGYLTITVKGGMFFDGDNATTTAQYGVVSVCAGDGL